MKPGMVAIKTIAIQNAINGLLMAAENCPDPATQSAIFNIADHLTIKLVEAKRDARMQNMRS